MRHFLLIFKHCVRKVKNSSIALNHPSMHQGRIRTFDHDQMLKESQFQMSKSHIGMSLMTWKHTDSVIHVYVVTVTDFYGLLKIMTFFN